jgi:hypothetical protein
MHTTINQDRADYGIVITMSALSIVGATMMLTMGFYMDSKERSNFALVQYIYARANHVFSHPLHALPLSLKVLSACSADLLQGIFYFVTSAIRTTGDHASTHGAACVVRQMVAYARKPLTDVQRQARSSLNSYGFLFRVGECHVSIVLITM